MPLLRLLLIVPALLALVGAWYAGRWYVGNSIAEFTPRVEAGAADSAQTALDLAPNDPLSHWAAGLVAMKEYSTEQQQEAVGQFEKAVSLSPNDYRLWMDLGRAREQAGDAPGAEKALRRAVELAPSYSYPRWHLGNLLLRQGRRDEAFAELRLAGETDQRFRPQILNLAWYVYGEDEQAVEEAVGKSADARADLAVYLIARERFDDALKVWSSLSPAEKKQQRETGEALSKALLAAKRYRALLDVSRDLAPPSASLPEVGEFINGSFESDVGTNVVANAFGWQVKTTPEAQLAVDPRTSRQGARSLRVVFNSNGAFAFNSISQLVVVEPSTDYHFECYVRTQSLKSAGTPTIEVVDPTDGSHLGTSAQLPNGDNEWQLVTIDFKTPAKTEAVTVRTARASCGPKMAVCPIFGMVWYDDFNLKRVGAAAGS